MVKLGRSALVRKMRESSENQIAAMKLFKGEKRDQNIDIKTFKSEGDVVQNFTMDDAKNIILSNAF